MNQPTSIHVLEVWGEFACFSPPELKVERWSYPCPTPSAARGIFDAIYAKPAQFRWQLNKIEILAPRARRALAGPSPDPAPPSLGLTYVALRRNEVGHLASSVNIRKWMEGAQPTPLFADDPATRQQRQTMALRDPHYRLHAAITPWAGYERQQTAFDEQFRRRASHGKCFYQPALGCREFVAFFRLIDDVDGHRRDNPPIAFEEDVGFMVYDVFDLSRPGRSDSAPSVSLFHAVIRGGVLDIPPYESPDVRKPERRAG